MTDALKLAREALPEYLLGHWETPQGRDKACEYAVKTRAELALPDHSDLYLANALYLADGDLHIQTAAKERMRWLSVQLALVMAECDRLSAALASSESPPAQTWTEEEVSSLIADLRDPQSWASTAPVEIILRYYLADLNAAPPAQTSDEGVRKALESIRDGLWVNHTSKWCHGVATRTLAALSRGEVGWPELRGDAVDLDDPDWIKRTAGDQWADTPDKVAALLQLLRDPMDACLRWKGFAANTIEKLAHHPEAGAPSRSQVARLVLRVSCSPAAIEALEEKAHPQWTAALVAADAILALYPTPPAPPVDDVAALRRYRAVAHWIGADSWDGCPDCIARLRWAAETDANRTMSSDEVAAAMREFTGPAPSPPALKASDLDREKIAQIIDPETFTLPRINLYKDVFERAYAKADSILALISSGGDHSSRASMEIAEMAARLLAYRSRNEWGDPIEHAICEEASDLLTRLSAERDRLEGLNRAYDKALAEANKLFPMRLRGGEPDPLARAIANLEIATARAERAEAERDALKARLQLSADNFEIILARATKYESDLTALKARVAEVLEPFATAFEVNSLDGPCITTADAQAMRNHVWTNDFRRAAELHATLSGEVK